MSLAARLRAALADTASHDLTGDEADLAMDFTAAAVLVPITDRPEPGVLLTLRNANLRRHAGQVAFPGGRIDPEDAGPVAAALREAEEEIGLDPALVDLVGLSNRYQTGTGYDIVPVLGVVPPDLTFNPSEAEVDAIFEVPLAFLLETANHARKSATWDGIDRYYHEIWWQDWRIWGATAGMIVNLAGRLKAFA